MLDIQVLALTLIPLLSGVVPLDTGSVVLPEALLGIEERVAPDFLVGTWKFSDEFFRWGVTDREKAKQKPFRGHSLMCLRKDGSMTMINFFNPAEGRWEVTGQGLLIYDPKFPERGSQILPVRKRDNDRIWLLLPFSGGSVGIGMIRVAEEEPTRTDYKTNLDSKKKERGRSRPRSSFFEDGHTSDAPHEKTLSGVEENTAD